MEGRQGNHSTNGCCACAGAAYPGSRLYQLADPQRAFRASQLSSPPSLSPPTPRSAPPPPRSGPAPSSLSPAPSSLWPRPLFLSPSTASMGRGCPVNPTKAAPVSARPAGPPPFPSAALGASRPRRVGPFTVSPVRPLPSELRGSRCSSVRGCTRNTAAAAALHQTGFGGQGNAGGLSPIGVSHRESRGLNSRPVVCRSAVRDAHGVPAVPGEGQEGDHGPRPKVSSRRRRGPRR